MRLGKGVEKVWKEIGENQDEMLPIAAAAGYKTKLRDMMEERGKAALYLKIDEEEHLKIYGGLVEGIRMKTYLHGPMDAAEDLRLRLRVGDLDLPERRMRYITGSRVEEVRDRQMCHCGKAVESRSHIVAKCELYEEERAVLEGEMQNMNEGGIESCGALDVDTKFPGIVF